MAEVDKKMKNCVLCNSADPKVDWYISEDSDYHELNCEGYINDNNKLIISVYTGIKYIGFIEIDMNYCPKCGRELRVEELSK